MDVTIIAGNGAPVKAPAEQWLCGVIAVLTDEQKARLLELVGQRLVLAKPTGHVISVPGIVPGERFGKLGGEG